MHHGAGLRRLARNEALIEHLKREHNLAPISEADKVMLDFAAKLTRTPWEMIKADVDKLKDFGFSEPAILDITQITGYFNFVNRLADGLGVELEDYWKEK